MPKKWQRLAVILAAVGFLISAWLQWLHIQTYLYPSEHSFCAVGQRFNCETVAFSSFSVFLGIPVAFWGMVGFAFLLFAIDRRPALFLPLSAIAALCLTILFGIELAAIGSICILCASVHLLSLGLLAIAWRTRNLSATRAYLFANIRQLVIDLLFPILALLAARLFAPPYWLLVSWQSDLPFEQGVDEEGRPWMGASQAEPTVYEFVDYACPHCAVASMRMRLWMGKNPTKIRLVRIHQPRMRCVPAEANSQRCIFARAAICAGMQHQFWEMDDWLFHHIPGKGHFDLQQAAQDLGLDLEAMQTCLDAEQTFQKAEQDASKARKLGIKATPQYLYQGEKLSFAQVMERLSKL